MMNIIIMGTIIMGTIIMGTIITFGQLIFMYWQIL